MPGRLDVAIGLVQEPPILFLDEPSTGLDPQRRVNLQEQARRLNTELGTTIVLTTHYLEEADALAGRVIAIDHGTVIADDSAAALKSALGDLVAMDFADGDAARAAARRADRVAGSQVRVSGTHVELRAAFGRDAAPGLVAELAAAGTAVVRLEVVGPTLDDVFLDLTGRSLREAQDATSPSTDTTEGTAA